jgi:hypothetical protein
MYRIHLTRKHWVSANKVLHVALGLHKHWFDLHRLALELRKQELGLRKMAFD